MNIGFLHLADTHLGVDYPLKPRKRVQNRGEDFFKNYELIFSSVLHNSVDFVIHSGDLFNRSKPPLEVISKAYAPLLNLANQDIPVFLVPGNHERSFFPRALLLAHPNVHTFLEPSTHCFKTKGLNLAITGIPFIRRNARLIFREHLKSSGWSENSADIKILAVHQIFDTAVVGPQRYVFTGGEDVVRRSDIPRAFHYIAAGHVHPHQYLRNPFDPEIQICYAGSIERVSFMERNEEKGYITGTITDSLIKTRFVKLPARPMQLHEWQADDLHASEIKSRIESLFHELHSRSICRIKITGPDDRVKNAVSYTRELLTRYPKSPQVKVIVPRSPEMKNKRISPF